MEWVDRFNSALDLIEKELTEDIPPSRLAETACCSEHHFQRMFSYIAGVPLAEYIRRRRMSLAAVELREGARVVDVALRYGYDSPTAFNRAFQTFHGVAPSAVREPGVSVRSFPPMRFHLSVSGGAALSYRMETPGPIRIVGISAPLGDNLEENFAVAPALWEKAAREGVLPGLLAYMSGQPKGLLGVSVPQGDSWRYFIAVASTQNEPETMDVAEIPAYTWAAFSGEGACPQAIQELERRIVTEWLPTSGYEYDNGPDLEIYLNPDPAQATFEVWIPVIRGKQATQG